MSNKQLSVGKLKNKTGEEFYPKTVWEAILDAPDMASGIGKVFTVTNDSLESRYALAWSGLKTINNESIFGNGNIQVVNPSDLPPVAVSGSYNDLFDKPTIPTNLSELEDINLSNLSDNQILTYDSATNKWINSNYSGGEGALYIILRQEGNSVVCDTSISDIIDAIESRKSIYCLFPFWAVAVGHLFYYYYDAEERDVVFLAQSGSLYYIIFQGRSLYTDGEWNDNWEIEEHYPQLDDIEDVFATDPQDGQVLTYSSSEGKWTSADVNIKAKTGTTAYWNSRVGYIPEDGEIIVYTDYSSKVVNNETVYIPGVKIGSGNGYVQDLAFVSEDIAESLLAHTGNTNIHVTSEDKTKWNSKLNVDDNQEVIGETLVFNRN